jgi:hypothetical protein
MNQRLTTSNRTQILANKIIKMFIDENVPLSIQLESLKLAKEKIEWCRKTGKEMSQQMLDL